MTGLITKCLHPFAGRGEQECLQPESGSQGEAWIIRCDEKGGKKETSQSPNRSRIRTTVRNRTLVSYDTVVLRNTCTDSVPSLVRQAGGSHEPVVHDRGRCLICPPKMRMYARRRREEGPVIYLKRDHRLKSLYACRRSDSKFRLRSPLLLDIVLIPPPGLSPSCWTMTLIWLFSSDWDFLVEADSYDNFKSEVLALLDR